MHIMPLATLAIIAVDEGTDNDPNPYGEEYRQKINQARLLRECMPNVFADLLRQAHVNVALMSLYGTFFQGGN